MLKTIAFIARKDATRRDDFREHYENHHVEIALPHLPKLQKYVRNHIHSGVPFEAAGQAVEPGFDVATEFWFPDRRALEELMVHLASEAASVIRDDELTFMNKDANVFCAAVETLVLGPDRDIDLGDCIKVLALAKRPAHQSRDEFLAHYEEKMIPRLLEGSATPLRCTHNQTHGVAGIEPPFDCVTELWFPGTEGALAHLAHLEPEALRWLLLRVIECETPMDVATT